MLTTMYHSPQCRRTGYSKASLIVHRELYKDFDIIILIRASDSTYQSGDDDFFDNSSFGVKVLKSTVRRFYSRFYLLMLSPGNVVLNESFWG